MSALLALLAFAIVGAIVYAIIQQLPLPPTWKSILLAVALLILLVVLLNYLGLFDGRRPVLKG